jgi:hypothetical protein
MRLARSLRASSTPSGNPIAMHRITLAITTLRVCSICSQSPQLPTKVISTA